MPRGERGCSEAGGGDGGEMEEDGEPGRQEGDFVFKLS